MEKKISSANKKWKESGTTLSFKEWIDRENKKMDETTQDNFLPFVGFDSLKPDTSGVKDTIKDTLDRAKDNVVKSGGYKNEASNSDVLGLNKGVLIFSASVIAFSLGAYFYTKWKNKNG